jgi:two-component system, cell cycle sensor histidine kinase and response regulator CckA
MKTTQPHEIAARPNPLLQHRMVNEPSYSEKIRVEIQQKLGFVPPFFAPAMQNPLVLENLWQQTLQLYINNPLPALFKEKLSAYLSRFCAVPYCMICHSCSLYNLGMEAHQILELLESAPPTETEIDQHIDFLAKQSAPIEFPEPNSGLEASLLTCAIFVALQHDRAEYCRAELRRLLDTTLYQYLTLFIAYIKTCHIWMESNPGVVYEVDQRVQNYFQDLTKDEPALADFFVNYWERVQCDRQTWTEQQAAIVERKRSEAAMRDMAVENLRLARIVAATSEGILITDPNQPDNPIIYANPAFSRITGYEPEEIIGRNCRFLQGADTDPKTVTQLRQAIQQRQEIKTTLLNYRKDGQPFWNELKISPVLSETGELVYFVGFQTDVTEQKRAEQKICEQAALLDVATDAIFVRDLNHQILFWSKGAERLYGWKAEEILEQNAIDLLNPVATPQLTAALNTVVEHGEWQGELQQVTQGGKPIVVESRWTLMRDSSGEPRAILVVNTDITEKKQLEAQFLRAQRMESIGTLASGIAHDLNNELTPILASAQLLLMHSKIQENKRQQLLENIQNSAKRGATLIKQVLSFARGVEGKRTVLQIRHLVSEIRQIVQETFPKSIEVHLDLPNDLWLVSGDATQLHQVLMNLCVNARDAMSEGGTLSLSATNLVIDENYMRMNLDAQVGPYVMVSVSDTGMGIPPEALDRIFEPFFTTKELGKGTGLGLSTVLGIVKSHGGFVEVLSSLGSGTQFKIYIPAVQAIETLPVQDDEPVAGEGELILVVDDEASIREVNQASLETHNYRVLTACDGIEAIAHYVQRKDEIDLVLIDMMMPSMDGMTAIRTLNKINPQVKIIAVSGLLSNTQIPEPVNSNIQAFLPKPYTAKELVRTIHQVLQQK